MSKGKRLTAEAAVQLADEYNAAGGPETTAPVRPLVVTAILNQYLDAIERKARGGGRRVLTHEVSALRMRVSQGEKAAALEGLRNLGYTVDDRGVSW